MRGPSFWPATRFLRALLAATAITAVAGLLSAGSSSAGATSVPSAAVPADAAGGGAVPGTGGGTGSGSSPLAGVLGYLHSREGVAQVAVFNKVTGRTYLLSEGPDLQYTASIVKADILAMWLRRYQSSPGTIPASIPYSIRYLMTNMITMSDNVAATSLFYFGGGCLALTAFNQRIPTRGTRVGCQTPTYYGWGNTTTTAADQVAIVKTLAYPGPLLITSARDYGLQLMESVIPAQRWGVTCGPWGTACSAPDYASPVPGVTVALKNGWKYVPTCTQQDQTCPWQVNSMGWVQGQGRNYVLAVLSTDDPAGAGSYGFDYGIATIQGVSQLVWGNLAP